MLSLACQNLLLLLAAALVSSRTVVLPSQWDWIIIALLAASAGVQVVMVSIILLNAMVFIADSPRLAQAQTQRYHQRCSRPPSSTL